LNDGPTAPDLSRSICQEVIDEFSRSDDSLAQMVEDAHLEIRDFMALSLVCDQSTMSLDQLVRALGLSRESVLGCIERLEQVGLLDRGDTASRHDGHEPPEVELDVTATAQGRKLTRRILGSG